MADFYDEVTRRFSSSVPPARYQQKAIPVIPSASCTDARVPYTL